MLTLTVCCDSRALTFWSIVSTSANGVFGHLHRELAEMNVVAL